MHYPTLRFFSSLAAHRDIQLTALQQPLLVLLNIEHVYTFAPLLPAACRSHPSHPFHIKSAAHSAMPLTANGECTKAAHLTVLKWYIRSAARKRSNPSFCVHVCCFVKDLNDDASFSHSFWMPCMPSSRHLSAHSQLITLCSSHSFLYDDTSVVPFCRASIYLRSDSSVYWPLTALRSSQRSLSCSLFPNETEHIQYIQYPQFNHTYILHIPTSYANTYYKYDANVLLQLHMHSRKYCIV